MNHAKKMTSQELNNEIAKLDPGNIPSHVAIIMDGNRRWAQRKGLSKLQGHQQGAEQLLDITLCAQSLGIKALTAFGLSTENWLRPQQEVQELLDLLKNYLDKNTQKLIDNNIRLYVIGDLSRFDQDTQNLIQKNISSTSLCTGIQLVLALNYGGRDDLKRAVVMMAQKVEEGKLHPQDITEEIISQHLDTALWPDPDLVIRTSGELRLSNFLLWQLSYTELYVSKTYWPEFTSIDFVQAICSFQQRQRRLGSI